MTFSNSIYVKAAAAAVVLAAAGTASVAQAASDVYFSIGAQVAPGVTLGVSNAPAYYPRQTYVQPVYVQPQPYYAQAQPYYVQPAPVYVRPAPVYYPPAVYVQRAPVYGVGYYYGPPAQHRHRIHSQHWNQRRWDR